MKKVNFIESNMIEGLKELFEPESVAVVGASTDPNKIGNEILKSLIENGYKGKIFPINPKVPEVLGLKAFSSVKDVPENIDLAIFIIPSKFILGSIEECALKGVKSVIIISSGFGEIGLEGKLLEQSLIKTARIAGIRVVGPNCQGITNPYKGLLATFGGFTPLKGPIGMISQSGSVSGGIQCLAERDGIGISKLINLGNKSDVNEIDLLQYLKKDENTKVIALYLEGFTDGKEFLKILREVVKIKPVVILKGGRTQSGMKASASHTGSLAGNAEIIEAAIKQSGGIWAESFEEFYDFTKIFALNRDSYLHEGSGPLIIESSGGAGTLAADTIDKLKMKLPKPKEDAIKKLKEFLSPICTFNNPFDIGPNALEPGNFEKIIEENASNDEIHSFLILIADPVPGVAEVLKRSLTKTSKPIIAVCFGDFDIGIEETRKLQSFDIPVFPSSERGVKAINALIKYFNFLRSQK